MRPVYQEGAASSSGEDWAACGAEVCYPSVRAFDSLPWVPVSFHSRFGRAAVPVAPVLSGVGTVGVVPFPWTPSALERSDARELRSAAVRPEDGTRGCSFVSSSTPMTGNITSTLYHITLVDPQRSADVSGVVSQLDSPVMPMLPVLVSDPVR